MHVIKVKDYDAMSEKACDMIIGEIKENEKAVLGLATGSTPEGLYERLIEKYNNHDISFKQTKTFNLDEYVGLDRDDKNSYYYYMKHKLFKHIDIPENQAILPDGKAENIAAECERYEKKIKDAGQIDIQVLGIGLNGHIGFNEPNTPFTSRTHVVKLDESTRQANARFFNSIDEVPTEAITMGIETIMESKKIILLVSGEKKADILAKVIYGEITEEVPASVLQRHPDVTIIADEAARSKLKDI